MNKEAIRIYEERRKLLKREEEGKEKSKQEEVNRLIKMILSLFKASNEIPVAKVRIDKAHSSCKFSCSIAFSKESVDYYYRRPADPYRFATSEQILKCGKDKEIKDVPIIVDRLSYFDTALFSTNEIFDDVYEELKKLSPQYMVIKDGAHVLEVIINL